MLKPPGKAFAKVAVASTLCPGCSERIEHPTNYAVEAVTTASASGTQTKLVANRTIVIHACTQPRTIDATSQSDPPPLPSDETAWRG